MQVLASGKVSVEAELPVKASVWSVDEAVAEEVNDRKARESEPLTSKVELGEVVAIPTWAFTAVVMIRSNKTNVVFIILN